MTERNSAKEEFRVDGDELVKKIKQIISEGNVRRVVVKSDKGATLVEFPVTVGVVGLVLAPTFAALGALAALVTKCTIVVERK